MKRFRLSTLMLLIAALLGVAIGTRRLWRASTFYREKADSYLLQYYLSKKVGEEYGTTPGYELHQAILLDMHRRYDHAARRPWESPPVEPSPANRGVEKESVDE